ncbi:MAG: RecX family transcriptional regulator [Chlorobi bacterium]|nr:RecX family transcriptional regulator [Chlorobiota bacterium]
MKTRPRHGKEKAEALIRRFCLYRERSSHETRRRLLEYGLDEAEAEEILGDLRQNGLVDDERFAREFVRSKFRLNRWGKEKIRRALLYDHRLSPELIRRVTEEEIDEETYGEIMHRLIKRKLADHAHKEPAARKAAIYRYMVSKGFDPSEFLDILEDELRKNLA